METKNTNKKKRTRNTRMMPHSIEAEQSVLGCCLIDDNVPVQVMNKLKVDDYYTQAHQTIFEAMNKIYQENKPIDFVTLTDELERMGAMESVGGIDYITTLTNIVPSAANFTNKFPPEVCGTLIQGYELVEIDVFYPFCRYYIFSAHFTEYESIFDLHIFQFSAKVSKNSFSTKQIAIFAVQSISYGR